MNSRDHISGFHPVFLEVEINTCMISLNRIAEKFKRSYYT